MISLFVFFLLFLSLSSSSLPHQKKMLKTTSSLIARGCAWQNQLLKSSHQVQSLQHYRSCIYFTSCQNYPWLHIAWYLFGWGEKKSSIFWTILRKRSISDPPDFWWYLWQHAYVAGRGYVYLKQGNSSHLHFYTAAEQISNCKPAEKQNKADQNVKEDTGEKSTSSWNIKRRMCLAFKSTNNRNKTSCTEWIRNWKNRQWTLSNPVKMEN